MGSRVPRHRFRYPALFPLSFRFPLYYIFLLSSLLLNDVGAFPSPLTIPTNGAQWLAQDWSAVEIFIGSPASQRVRLIPSTGTSKVFVLNPSSCQGGSECSDRGGNFDSATSGSYKRDQRIGALGLRPELYPEEAKDSVKYGTDNVTIQGDGGTVKVGDIVIGSALQTTPLEYVGILQVGMLGLGPRVIPVSRPGDTNTTNFPGLLAKLYLDGKIPSQSWAYTAGAYNKKQGIPTDLILGGYNSALTTKQNATFSLDENLDLHISLSSLTVSATGNTTWGSGSQNLLTSNIRILIDSTTPYLWLPQQVCSQFEKYLGLIWDPVVKMYLLGSDDSRSDDPADDKKLQGVRENMKQLNVSFTFTLSDLVNQTKSVKIALSYDSFNLRIPYSSLSVYANGTSSRFANATNSDRIMRYFPLKRATSEEQYTLGRAFLQEAYIITDYDRQNFQVHQRSFDNSQRVVVPIAQPTQILISPVDPKKIIGIVLGLIVGISILVIVGFCLWKRRSMAPEDRRKGSIFNLWPRANVEYYRPDVKDGPIKLAEVGGTNIVELEGENRPHEMEGDIPPLPQELPADNLAASREGNRPTSVDPMIEANGAGERRARGSRLSGSWRSKI